MGFCRTCEFTLLGPLPDLRKRKTTPLLPMLIFFRSPSPSMMEVPFCPPLPFTILIVYYHQLYWQIEQLAALHASKLLLSPTPFSTTTAIPLLNLPSLSLTENTLFSLTMAFSAGFWPERNPLDPLLENPSSSLGSLKKKLGFQRKVQPRCVKVSSIKGASWIRQ